MVLPAAPRAERRPPPASGLRDDLAALRIDRTRRGGRRFGAVLSWLLALAFLGTAGGGGYWYLRDNLQAPLAVKTDAVRRISVGQARAVLTATGYLESRRQAAIGARGAGRIAELYFEEGTQVHKGDLLAVLEHSDLKAMLEFRVVAVEQAQAELEQAEHLAAQRERDFNREKELNARGASTSAALETAETEARTTKARATAMRAAVKAAQAHVHEAEEAIRNMHVYAPFDGTVISKDAELGETIMPGGMGAASGRGSVATIADLDALEVDTDVKEDYLGQISRGQPAEIVVDAVPDRRYRGRLREIIPQGDRTRGIVKVKVQVLDADERLFPELSATVHFQPREDAASTEEPAQGLFVPVSAVVEGEGDRFIWVLGGERASRVPVTVNGEPNDGLACIEGELLGGETVIIEPPAELTPEMRVRSQ